MTDWSVRARLAGSGRKDSPHEPGFHDLPSPSEKEQDRFTHLLLTAWTLVLAEAQGKNTEDPFADL